MSSCPVYVLDSWPVLEWIYRKQPAASKFRLMLDQADAGLIKLHMSQINLGEVIYSAKRRLKNTEAETRLNEFAALPVNIHTVDDALVDASADLKALYSTSYADAFDTALGIRLGAPVVTGDKEFLVLEQTHLVQLLWMGA